MGWYCFRGALPQRGTAPIVSRRLFVCTRFTRHGASPRQNCCACAANVRCRENSEVLPNDRYWPYAAGRLAQMLADLAL